MRFIYLWNSYKRSAYTIQKPSSVTLPSFSIVICAYNETSSNIALLLNSVKNSTTQPQQIVIIDDNSAVPLVVDSTWQSDILLIRNPVNIGKKQSQGVALDHLSPVDYILYLDSDIEFEKNTIEQSLDFISAHPDGNVYGVRILIRDFKKDYLNTFIHTSYHNDYNKRLFESYYGVTTSCNGAFMFCNYKFFVRNVNTYLGETLGGKPLLTGNDKSLTNLALQSGKSYTIPDVSVKHDNFEFSSYLSKIQRTFKTSIIYQLRAIFLKNVSPLVRIFSVLDVTSFFISAPLQVLFFIALCQLKYFYIYAIVYLIFLAIRNNRSLFKVISYALFRFSFTILLYLLRILTLLRIRSIGWGNR